MRRDFKIDCILWMQDKVLADRNIDLINTANSFVRVPITYKETHGYQRDYLTAVYDILGVSNGQKYTIRLYTRHGVEKFISRYVTDKTPTLEADNVFAYNIWMVEADTTIYKRFKRFPVPGGCDITPACFCGHTATPKLLKKLDNSPLCPKVGHLPTITLIGGNDLVFPFGSFFSDPGANAYDEEDGDLSYAIRTDIPDDIYEPGDHEVRYHVTDYDNNTVSVVRRVTVLPYNHEPVITLIPLNGESSTVHVPWGYPVADIPGATATDSEDGDITDDIVITGHVDTHTTGSYGLVYKVTDSGGKMAIVTRTVVVGENTAPTITLLPDDAGNTTNITIDYGSNTDDIPGALAIDPEEGDISSSIVITGLPNMLVPGSYTVTYTATDSGGMSISIDRTVIVPLNQAPVVTLLPDGNGDITPINIPYQGDITTIPGATAYDPEDGDVTNSLVVTGVVNTNQPGMYTLTYTAKDQYQMVGSAIRQVIVGANLAPSITLLPDGNGAISPITLSHGTSSVADIPGAIANDPEDGDISSSIVMDASNVDYDTAGSYEVTYTVADSSGLSTTINRTVIIPNNQSPEITLLPDVSGAVSPLYVPIGWDISGIPGATATDTEDGDISSSIVMDTGNIDTSIAGDYIIHYTVKDANNNTTTVARQISVLVNHPPTITLIGDNPLIIPEETSHPHSCIYTVHNHNILGTPPPSGFNYVTSASTGEAYAQELFTIAGGMNPGANYTGIIWKKEVTTGSFIEFHSFKAMLDYFKDSYSTLDYGHIDVTVSASGGYPDVTFTTYCSIAYDATSSEVLTLVGSNYQPSSNLASMSYYCAGDALNALAVEVANNSAYTSGHVTPFKAVDLRSGSNLRRIDVLDANGNMVIANAVSVVFTPEDLQNVRIPYIDPGATAYDEEDGDITDDIATVVPNFYLDYTGNYTVNYTVTDNGILHAHTNPKTTHIERAVSVVNSEPVITVNQGPTQVTQGELSGYVDPGFTATTLGGDPIPANYKYSTYVETATYREYTYAAEDPVSHRLAKAARTVAIIPNQPPVITILGDNPYILPKIPGAGKTIWFAIKGHNSNYGSSNQKTVLHRVKMLNANGDSVLTYPVMGYVNLANGTELLDDNPSIDASVETHGTLSEVGFVFKSIYNANLDEYVSITSIELQAPSVLDNNHMPPESSFSLMYQIVDNGGTPDLTNSWSELETFHITPWSENEVKTFTVHNDVPLQGYDYTDPGATAVDYNGNDLTSVIEDTMDSFVYGVSTSVDYSVTDSGGGTDAKSRTISLAGVESAPIVITLADHPTNLSTGGPRHVLLDITSTDEWVDPGYTAMDTVDNTNVTSQVVVTGNINTSVANSWVRFTYKVTLADGRSAAVYRDVHIKPAPGQPPTLVLTDTTPIKVPWRPKQDNRRRFYRLGNVLNGGSQNPMPVRRGVDYISAHEAKGPNLTDIDTSISSSTLYNPRVSPSWAQRGWLYPISNPNNVLVEGDIASYWENNPAFGMLGGGFILEADQVYNFGNIEFSAFSPALGPGYVTPPMVLAMYYRDVPLGQDILVNTGEWTELFTEIHSTWQSGETAINTARLIPNKPFSWEEPGVSGKKSDLTDISNLIVVDDTGVDPHTLGTYQITYNLTDPDTSLSAPEITREVIVSWEGNNEFDFIGKQNLWFPAGDTTVQMPDPGVIAWNPADGKMLVGHPKIDATLEYVPGAGVDGDEFSQSYKLDDLDGKPFYRDRTVWIGNAIPPEISISPLFNGTTNHTVKQHSQWQAGRYKAVSHMNLEGDGPVDITDQVVVTNNVEIGIQGSYIAVYKVVDPVSGTMVQQQIQVEVVDNVGKYIRLAADSNGDVICCKVPFSDTGNWVDPGVSLAVINGVPVDASVHVHTYGLPVPLNATGEYEVTYRLTNTAGSLIYDTVKRYVTVVPRSLPKITPLDYPQQPDSDRVVIITVGDTYTDPGATAYDTEDGDLTSSITGWNTVDTTTVGVYEVVYRVSNSDGLTTERVRKVYVMPA